MATTAPVRRNPLDKHDERRRALAESALRTLGELGYAKSSLREMAANSEFTHGVVHYYFADKLELIVYCVRYYKARCVTRYDDVVENSRSADELLAAFAGKLRETIVDEAPMHRLWYDLRSQSMFEPALVEAVDQIDRTLAEMIWRVVTRYAELADRSLVVDEPEAYGMLDGVFQQAVLAHRDTADDAHLARLERQVHTLVPLMVGAAPLR